MSHPPLDAVLRHVRRLATEEAPAEVLDQDLLQRFADTRDEAAFAQLVRRHGAMVLGVCRRVLHDPHAADDAFQATFLALARRPGSVRKQASVGSWLHRIAHRVALRARFAAGRRRALERRASVGTGSDPQAEISWREMSQVLDAELQALPESFRAPLVLCYLEGLTRDEAAQQLGWSVGTVKGRLERGREMLRRRLTRRGITVGAALLGTGLTQGPALALPGALAAQTVRFALPFANGQVAGLPRPVALLARGVLRTLVLTRLKTAAWVLLLTCLTAGATLWARGRSATGVETVPPSEPSTQVPTPQPSETPGPQAAHADRYGDPLPPHALARLGTVRFRHDWTLYARAISPDGRFLAGGGNQAVQVWDAETGKTLYRLTGYINGVTALGFSPDSKRLASYDHNMKLRLTDVATGRMVKDFNLKKDAAFGNSYMDSSVAFLPDGKTLVLKDGKEPVVRLLDADSGAEIRAFRGEGQHLNGVAFSADGAALAVGEDDGTVRVWEVATGKERHALKKPARSYPVVAFAPDGKTLAAGGGDGVVILYDTVTARVVHKLEALTPELTALNQAGKQQVVRNYPLGIVRSLSFSPDGKRLLSSYGYWIVLWDPATGKEVRRLPHDAAFAVQFLPDGRTLLVGGDRSSHENTLSFLDATTGKPCRRFDGHDSRVEAIAYSPDAQYVATAEEGSSAEIRVWETSSGRVVFRDGDVHRPRATALAFSPKGDVLATGHGREIILWDWKAGKPLRTLPGHEHNHMALAFSADGSRLASGGHDGTVRLWDVTRGKELRSFRTEKGNAWAIAFSPDLRLAATGDQAEKTIHLWDLATGKEWKSLRREGAGSIRLDFSTDGRTLLEAGGVSTMNLWEVATGRPRRTCRLPAHAWTVAFSPDGRRIAVGELEARPKAPKALASRVAIELFDLPRNRIVAQLVGHDGTVYVLSFSPDSRILASASADTTALLWDVAALDASPPPAPLSPDQRSACWADLGGDSRQAYGSMWRLAEDPGTVDLLRKELSPAPAPPGADVVGPLLADLNSGQFAVRSRAHARLAQFGSAAEGALRKALADRPSLEVRQRIQDLLSALDSQQVRNRRAVEVLEGMNTAAARRLLETLARGADDAQLTREAKDSLERLRRRPVRGG